MKRTLRPSVTIGAALLVMAGLPANAYAQSSVKLYGQADAFVGAIHPSGASGTAWQVGEGGMSTSFWGIAGTEDLGNGLKAIFALEDFFLINNGKYGSYPGQSFFARNSYVGLESPFGTVTLGRNTVPLFVSTILFNPLGDSFIFSPMVLHTYIDSSLGPASVQGDTGWDNSVLYATPSFGGLTGSLLYSNAGIAGHSGQANYGGNLLYFSGPFSATLAYQNVHTASIIFNGATQEATYQVGAAYDFKLAKVYGQYQYVNNNNGIKDNTYQLGGSVPAGPGSVLLSWARTKRDVDTGSGGIWNTYALGYNYPLSKRTNLYATYMYDKITNQSSGSSFGLGMRHQF